MTKLLIRNHHVLCRGSLYLYLGMGSAGIPGRTVGEAQPFYRDGWYQCAGSGWSLRSVLVH